MDLPAYNKRPDEDHCVDSMMLYRAGQKMDLKALASDLGSTGVGGSCRTAEAAPIAEAFIACTQRTADTEYHPLTEYT
jgi:hypothetical protein